MKLPLACALVLVQAALLVQGCKAIYTEDPLAGDAGYADSYRGWYDVQGCGKCNDYCRWVGDNGSGGDPSKKLHVPGGHNPSWWSCRLAGGSSSYSPRNHFTSFTHKKCSGMGAQAPQPTVVKSAALPAHQAAFPKAVGDQSAFHKAVRGLLSALRTTRPSADNMNIWVGIRALLSREEQPLVQQTDRLLAHFRTLHPDRNHAEWMMLKWRAARIQRVRNADARLRQFAKMISEVHPSRANKYEWAKLRARALRVRAAHAAALASKETLRYEKAIHRLAARNDELVRMHQRDVAHVSELQKNVFQRTASLTSENAWLRAQVMKMKNLVPSVPATSPVRVRADSQDSLTYVNPWLSFAVTFVGALMVFLLFFLFGKQHSQLTTVPPPPYPEDIVVVCSSEPLPESKC